MFSVVVFVTLSINHHIVRVRHAQRRGRRREEELPVAVAAGRRRREDVRFVEEHSERPLAADDARRVDPERAGDEPGGQALLRPRGVLRPLSKAERALFNNLDADVRPGPGPMSLYGRYMGPR